MSLQSLRVMVLAGGPDRERPVSLQSGATITAALAEAGHVVEQRDITPLDLSALDEFVAWRGDVVFPILHGPWGEGGGLQRILDQRGLPYVGSSGPAADLCMDKQRTKVALQQAGLPTPPSQLLGIGDALTLSAPLVLKPLREGSSIDVAICPDDAAVQRSRAELATRHSMLLAEKFIAGIELTVGVVGGPAGYEPLPPIQIQPAAAFYDYEAKYQRDDTRYVFDIKLPPAVLDRVRTLALEAHRVLGCRHLSRVDMMVDAAGDPWIIEVNTLPGFTSHSLLPMAARHAGIPTATLVDRLARLPLGA